LKHAVTTHLFVHKVISQRIVL